MIVWLLDKQVLATSKSATSDDHSTSVAPLFADFSNLFKAGMDRNKWEYIWRVYGKREQFG